MGLKLNNELILLLYVMIISSYLQLSQSYHM